MNESITLPTAQQKRILRLMLNGDLIWEVAGKSYRSIYNERLSHQQRVPASTVEEMEQQGWIRRLDNPNSSRLDGWEMTEQGRAFAAQLRTRGQAKPEAPSLSD
jgi:DNA-binding MarR family transcriptional regulator